jgi:hypothetical protein
VGKTKKCCGTCGHWARDQEPPSCHWPEPPLPFWANINNGDHGDYTEASDGSRCLVWAEKTEA